LNGQNLDLGLAATEELLQHQRERKTVGKKGQALDLPGGEESDFARLPTPIGAVRHQNHIGP